MKKRFLALFILLSLDTILLLVLAVLFFSSAPVLIQWGDWARQLSPSTIAFQIARGALFPQPQERSLAEIPIATLTPTPTPALSLPRDMAALEPEQRPEPTPTTAGPTPTPYYEVVEEPPPSGNLVIPSLDVNQPLVLVEARETEWDLSALGDQVGWLETTGTYPGDDLAMVVIGHITLPYPGGAGPFLNLRNLKDGDLVEYHNGQEAYIYMVESHTVVSPDQVAALYRPDGNRLLLLTCTGYNAVEQRYDMRLLVEAVLIGVETQRPSTLIN